MMDKEEEIDIQEVLENRSLTAEQRAQARTFLIESLFSQMTTTQYLQYLLGYEEKQEKLRSTLKEEKKTQMSSEVGKFRFK